MAATETPIQTPDFCGIFTIDDFIDPDPDIAGIGVILAFTVIGAVIMSLISIKLFIEWRRDFSLQLFIAPPREEGLTEGGRRPTIQDARRYVEREAADEMQVPGRQGRMALSSTLFGLADTQFASGIAICAAALAKHDITSYHFSICNEMAWLAQITSIGGFVTARTVHDKANTAKKTVRVALMWCLTGLTMAVDVQRNDDIGYAEQVFTAGPYRDESDVVSRFLDGFFYAFTFLGLVFDTISLWPELALLIYYHFGTLLRALSRRSRSARASFPSRPCPQCTGRTTIRGVMRHVVVHLGVAVVSTTLWTLLWMVFVGIYWFTLQPIVVHLTNCFYFGWGVWLTFRWRREGRECMKAEERGDEDLYGFGQVVALTLLLSPIIANADAWYHVWSRRLVPTFKFDGSSTYQTGSELHLLPPPGSVSDHPEDGDQAPASRSGSQEALAAPVDPVLQP